MLKRRKRGAIFCFCMLLFLQMSCSAVFAEEQAAENIGIVISEDDIVTVENGTEMRDTKEKKVVYEETIEDISVDAHSIQDRMAVKEEYEKAHYLDEMPEIKMYTQPEKDTKTTNEIMAAGLESEIRRHRVAVGYGHSVFLRDDGKVFTWGVYFDDAFESYVREITEPEDTTLSHIVSVACGKETGFALDEYGGVWIWDARLYPVPEEQYMDFSEVPVRIDGLENIVEISAQEDCLLARREDGTVWKWKTEEEEAEAIKDKDGNVLNNIIAISAGAEHSLALNKAGELYAWGDNFYGQLGDGTRENRAYADIVRTVDPAEEITDIKAGDGYNCIETSAGERLAWGKSDEIEGYHFQEHLWTPTLLTAENLVQQSGEEALPPGTVAEISTNSDGIGLALCTDGSVWRCGSVHIERKWNPENYPLEYEFEIYFDRTPWSEMKEFASEPPEIIEASDEIISASAFNDTHTMAVVDGILMAAGSNKYGQLGNGGGNAEDRPVPVKNYLGEMMEDVKKVSCGYGYSLILNNDGRVWSVGYNEYGKLGDGGAENQNVVYPVRGKNGNGFLRDFVDVAAGYRHSLAVKADGSVWAWGSNGAGQLGTNNHTMSITPTRVWGISGQEWITNAVSAYANANCSMVLTNEGTVYMWGNNDKGQLGNGNKVNQSSPVQVKGENGEGYLNNIMQIATAEGCSLALDQRGRVWTWGGNQNGRLGDGTTNERLYPGLVQKTDGTVLEDIVQISAGYYFNAALDSYGRVWVWGKNNKGQLGIHSTVDQYKAVMVEDEQQIGYITGIRSISCGKEYILAVDANGDKLAWGYNQHGQFGYGNVGLAVDYPSWAFIPTYDTQWVIWLNRQMEDLRTITGNVSLPQNLPNGQVITWTSSRSDLLTAEGILVNTPVFDTKVILEAQLPTGSKVPYTVAVPAKADGFTEYYPHEYEGVPSSSGQAGTEKYDAYPGWQFTYPGIANGTNGEVHSGQVIWKNDALTFKKLSPKQTLNDHECVIGTNTLFASSDQPAKSARIGITAKTYDGHSFSFAPVTTDGKEICRITLNGVTDKVTVLYRQTSGSQITQTLSAEVHAENDNNFEFYLNEDKSLSIVVNGRRLDSGLWLSEAQGIQKMKFWMSNNQDIGEAGSIKAYIVDQAVDLEESASIFDMMVQGGKTYRLQLIGKDLKNVGDKVFKVTYDPAMLEVEDLIGITYEKDLSAGSAGGEVQILSYTPGEIKLKSNRCSYDDLAFNGLLDVVVVKGKTDGAVQISIEMEEM